MQRPTLIASVDCANSHSDCSAGPHPGSEVSYRRTKLGEIAGNQLVILGLVWISTVKYSFDDLELLSSPPRLRQYADTRFPDGNKQGPGANGLRVG